MSELTLSAAALHVVNQYNTTGKTLVGGYRTGVARLVRGAASRYVSLVQESKLPMFSEPAKQRVLEAQAKVNDFLLQRLDLDSVRALSLMDRVALGATSGIEALAATADKVQAPLATSILNTVGAAHMPLARLSVWAADNLAAGAQNIESKIAGDLPVKPSARRPKAAKPVARRARTARSSRTARKA